MNETSFWLDLEYRLSREFAGLPERRYQYFWCDGFTPKQYLLDTPAPRITGRCWICNGPKQAEWDFTLLLPASAESRGEIDWSAVVPPENKTHWMSIDEDLRYIEIEPAAAVPEVV